MSALPPDPLAAYQRWSPEAFDVPATPTAAPEATPSTPSAETEDAGELVTERITLPTAEDIERIHTEAHAEGFAAGREEGHAEGLATGMEEAKPHVDTMAALLDNLHTALHTLDQSVADTLLELAMETARQVVRGALRTDPGLILPVIREAITALPLHHGTITLFLHPDDVRWIKEHLGEQLGQTGWHLMEDSEIERGGCRLKAGASEVDATLATRWQRVLESIGAPASSTPADDRRSA